MSTVAPTLPLAENLDRAGNLIESCTLHRYAYWDEDQPTYCDGDPLDTIGAVFVAQGVTDGRDIDARAFGPRRGDPPPDPTLRALCDFLGMTPEQLVDWSDDCAAHNRTWMAAAALRAAATDLRTAGGAA